MKKGQFFIISAVVVVLILTLIQISIREYNQGRQGYDKSYILYYFNEVKREIPTSYFIDGSGSIENFIDFNSFVRKSVNEKNFYYESFSIILFNIDESPDKLNLTAVNFLKGDIYVNFTLNSTPVQQYGMFVKSNDYNSTVFNVDRNLDYYLELQGDSNYTINLDLSNKNLHIIFSEIRIIGNNIEYIDKVEKHIFLQ
ncbi:MAG: hypothetical protein QXM68_03115 [Candidatus Aenigmatarchaeota archaeon]|nr:hypothetical protein [Candidatus Aenigmarchaeota archaeon]